MVGVRTNAGVDQAAAFWFARMNGGATPSAEDEADLRRWLDADPAHAGAYRDCQAIWRMLDEQAAEPEMAALRAAALGRDEPPLSRRAVLGMAAGGAVAASCAGLWVLAAPSPARALISTKAGQRLSATLPDGSAATLAPLTRLRLNFGDGRRSATLERGQAWFDLTPDAARPFVLHVGGHVLRADGGRFQLTMMDARPDVVVEQGVLTVAERGGDAEVRVSAGQKSDGVRAISADVEAETAWRLGRLVVRDQPLSDVVAAFDRYSAEQLSIEDRAAGAKRISGSFRYDGAREFALALATDFDLAVKRTPDGVWRIRTPDGTATVR